MVVDQNKKIFNAYVFFTTFARSLIEVFIPVILYDFGYNLKEVIIYYLFVNLFSLIFGIVCGYIIEKFGYKLLNFFAVIFFVLLQIILNNMIYGFGYILIISLVFALYRRCYWIPRKYYNMVVIKKKDISISYSVISIINQLAIIFATYIGGFLLDFVDVRIVTIISTIFFLIGLIPLKKMEFPKKKAKFDLYNTLKKVPISNLYLFASYELINVLKFLFSLYLIIYVYESYSTVGIFDVISNVSVLFFTFIYGKVINKNKNYLHLSIYMSSIIYLLNVNLTSWLLIPISFFKSIFMKMHEISINKELLVSSKDYDYTNYTLVYEFVQNILRLFVTLILLFINNLKVMIYIVILFVFVGYFIKFRYKKSCK